MPANLTPQYLKAEAAFKVARTTEDRIAALEHMIAVLPKHKGTDHMLADLRRKLSKLRALGEQEGRSRKGGHDPYHVPKQGAGQILLLGPPNAGKSTLVAKLTRAPVQGTPYPFATTSPLPGMMPFEDVQIQLVDLPSIQGGHLPPGMLGLVKNTDAALLVADLAAPEVLEEMDALTGALQASRVRLFDRRRPPAPEPGVRDLPAMAAANKIDRDGARDVLGLLGESLEPRLPVVAVSATAGDGLEELALAAFRLLDRIRVYSKQPGKPADRSVPFILRSGRTVLDLAAHIHRDFPRRLRQVRVWGSARFDGQSVARDHVLRDGDVVELHVSG